MENAIASNDHLSTLPPSSPFAFVYVIGGCDPAQPAYRGYVYTILASTWIQQQCGSKADTIVYFQMSHKTNDTALPEQDVRPMHKLGIRVRYLPQNPEESFHHLILKKLMIVGLVEYSRVIFLDGDMMVRSNIDYYFDLSMKGILKENVIQRGGKSPVNAGFFMLTPEPGGYETIQQIIHDSEERYRHLPHPRWNDTLGWGHVIAPEDAWVDGSGRNGTKWNFYGAYSDQGLLFHWIKYVKKSFSVITGGHIEHWGSAGSGHRAQLESTMSMLDLHRWINTTDCHEGMTHVKSDLPNVFIHFAGKPNKPWTKKVPRDLNESTSLQTVIHFWFWTLMKVNDALEMNLGFDNWQRIRRPLLDTTLPKLFNTTKKYRTAGTPAGVSI
jgi:hypothetical protein